MSEAWTPKTQQAETWTAVEPAYTIPFDPNGFSRRPDFDTGPTSLTWDVASTQTETWAPQ